jgi:deazaflavin-dependent oxidoreductase (nitroreductase family)
MSDEETPLDPTIDWVREHLHRYVATDGENGYEWKPGVPTLVLTHRGRRSGKLRRTPLIYGRDGDNYVVVASFGGAPDHPNWYYNLTAEPEVTIQDRGEEMPATARTAEGDEREALWTQMTAVYPPYDQYQEKTSRRIPVVVLEPVTA